MIGTAARSSVDRVRLLARLGRLRHLAHLHKPKGLAHRHDYTMALGMPQDPDAVGDWMLNDEIPEVIVERAAQGFGLVIFRPGTRDLFHGLGDNRS